MLVVFQSLGIFVLFGGGTVDEGMGLWGKGKQSYYTIITNTLDMYLNNNREKYVRVGEHRTCRERRT